MNKIKHNDLELDILDLAEINLPFLDEPEIPAHHTYQKEHTRVWTKTVSGCDGFVIIFPHYSWGYPAVLKNAIEFLYDEWINKPVSLMCYGSRGGFQGLMGMKLVTQGLHMNSMPTNPHLNIRDDMFDTLGHFKDINVAFNRYKQPIHALAGEFAAWLS